MYDVTGTQGAAFFSPSGNIVCAIATPDGSTAPGSGWVRCDISEVSYAVPAAPKNCHGSYGLDLQLGKHAELGCITDTVAHEALLGQPPGGAPDYTTWFDPAGNPRVHLPQRGRAGAGLGYGNSIVDDAIQCTSRETGITCRNTVTGRGFHLSRESYRIF